jgi:hypothetical protein
MIEGVNTFVSTQPFHGEFYVYTANGLSGNKGYITLVPGATPEKCPAGRSLHATGKKLTPGIHPMAYLLGKPHSNPKLLVSVYDSVSLLRGFIDPSSPAFTRLNMPVLQNHQPQAVQSGSPAPPVVPEVLPVAAPVAPVADTVVAPVVAPVAAPVVPVIPEKLILAQRVTFPADDYTVNPAEAGSASLGTVSNIPGKLPMKVNTKALTENSMVFLTPLGRGPTLVAVSDLQPSLGQFTIAAGSVCTVNWLIIN